MMVPELVLREDLHEADPTLNETARDQTTGTVLCSKRIVEAVELLCGWAFVADVERFAGGGLHARSQLVTGDAGFQVELAGMAFQVIAVQSFEVGQVALLGRSFEIGRRIEVEDARLLRPDHG